MFIYYFIFFTCISSPGFIFCSERVSEKSEPKERTSLIDEKIEKAKKRSFEEELKIKKANEDIIEYKREIRISPSNETVTMYKEKIILTEQIKKDAESAKKLEDSTIKKLSDDKEKLTKLQNELVNEATSTQSKSESTAAENFQQCIKQKIYELFHIPPTKAPKTTEQIVEDFSKSLKKLISYERIYFTSTVKTTPEDWETVRNNALEVKPGEKNVNTTYQELIKNALNHQAALEKITGKKTGPEPRNMGVNCSLPFFASQFAAQKALEQLDEASNYDG